MKSRKHRRLLFAAVGCIVLSLAAWFEPTCVVKGWLRGEAFYEGRPTSYWSRELSRWQNVGPFAFLLGTPGRSNTLIANETYVSDPPARWNPFAEQPDGAAPAVEANAWVEVAAPGALAGRVDVRALTSYWTTDLSGYTRTPGFVDKVAGWFGVTLEYPDRPALLKGDPEALPVLRELLHDPDETVRGHAERALGRHNGEADLEWSIGW